MTLLDANQYTERFTFSFVMAMTVVPLPATNSNDKNNGNRKNGGAADAAICWFNETVVSATIWTRLPASYAGNVGMNATNSTYARDNNGFAPWPFAVQVEKTVVGKGDGILECKDAAGNTIASQYRERVRGEATTVSTTTRKQEQHMRREEEGRCECVYANFGLAKTTSQTLNVTGNRPAINSRISKWESRKGDEQDEKSNA